MNFDPVVPPATDRTPIKPTMPNNYNIMHEVRKRVVLVTPIEKCSFPSQTRAYKA